MNLARNRVRDRKRKGRDKGLSLEALMETGDGIFGRTANQPIQPRDEAMNEETAAELQACLDELAPGLRLPFVLRMFDDMNYQEIAEVMAIPVGTVKSRLNAARRALRDGFTRRGIL